MEKKQMKGILVKPIVTGIFCFIIAAGVLYLGIVYTQNTLEDLDKNCKTCSIFEEDCPYTDEELLKQEYGTNQYCNDMGIYEMKFKLIGGGSLVLSSTLLFIGVLNLWQGLITK